MFLRATNLIDVIPRVSEYWNCSVRILDLTCEGVTCRITNTIVNITCVTESANQQSPDQQNVCEHFPRVKA